MSPGKFIIHNIKKVFYCKRSRQKAAGFSIIEVIFVIAMLSLTIFVMISIFPYGLNKERGAEKITIATNLAQAKMEDLINTPYNQLTTGVITESSLATIDQDFASFSRTSEINYLDGDLNVAAEETDLKKIKITVSWIDAQEEDINDITLYSIITKQ